MNPIRQGDGTGLSVPGFSEVRKGDGTVLWSLEGELPANVIYPSQPLEQTTYEPYENVEPDTDVTNPVLTASDVTDEEATFVADPYLYVPDSDDSFSDWHMFFETARSNGAVIGHATSPDNGLTWDYNQTVINAESHLSMPHVFRSEGSYYLIANRRQDDYLPLYRAETWPTDWAEVNQWLSSGASEFKDHLLYWKDAESRWYLLIGTDDGGNNSGVRAYYSNQNESIENITWNAHPENPVVSGRPSAARAAGRGHILNDGEIVAFFQDTVAEYGDKARAFEITTLTTTSYADSEYSQSPILEESGSGWDRDRKHHYDPWWVDAEDKWRAAVDGYNGSEWSIGIYQAGPDTGGGTTVLVSDDFESGSLSNEWTGGTASASVQNNTVLNGSYSLQLDAGPTELLNAFSSGTQVLSFSCLFQTTNASEATYWRLYNNNTRNINVRVSGGDLEWFDGSSYNTVASGLSSNTTYSLEITNFDYESNSFDILLDGINEGGASFESGVSQHDEISFRMGNSTHTTYFDDVNVEGNN